MRITKTLVKQFINDIPLEIHCLAIPDDIGTVGIKWGYCQEANEKYGRNTVLKILDILETKTAYQKLLDK